MSEVLKVSGQVIVFFFIGFFIVSKYREMNSNTSADVINGDFSKYHVKAQTKNLTIYTDPNCSICSDLKLFLQAENILYLEKDILISKYKREIDELGIKSVPLIIYEDKLIVGFDKDLLSSIID